MPGPGFALLGGAVGAGQGLEKLLAQRIAEQERQAQAQQQAIENQLRERQFGETVRGRQATEAATAEDRAFRHQLSRDQLAQALQIAEASQVGQTERSRESIAAQNARAQEAEQSRLELARLTASLRPPTSEPLYPVDVNGQIIYLPRSQASGRSAPPPAATRTSLAQGETSLAGLDRVAELFRPEYVGPAAGRMRSFGQQVPGVAVDQGFAEFESEVAAIRNSIIKAITGAQMSEPEARRIMQQIPNVTDKPEVFTARMTATRRNLEELQARMRGPYGGRPVSPMTPMPSH